MQTNSKLYKSQDDKALFGVCGGIAEYFKVDSIIVRLLFVLFTLMYGAGLLFYIIAALVIPTAPAGNAGSNPGCAMNDSSSCSTESLSKPAQYVAEDGTRYENRAAGSVKTPDQESNAQTGNSPVKAPEHPPGKTLGIALIALGVLIMIQVFLPWIDRRLILAGGLIFAGFVFLSKKQK
jgi:phage shock protein C